MILFDGYRRGMGLGGWMTNYKRMKFLPADKRFIITQGDREHFETYVTRWDIQNIAAMGMDHIRVAFDQVVLEVHDQPYVYREWALTLLDRFVDWCQAEGLKVVLNLHHAIGCYCDFAEDSSLLDSEPLMERFIRLWELLEHRYHDRDLVFEILNEVTSADSVKWNSLAGRTVERLRALNPTRKIIIGSAQWNSVHKLKELKLYEDPNIAYTFHFYGPGEFTHQKSTVNTDCYVYNREIPYPGDIAYYKDFQAFFGRNPEIYAGYTVMDRAYIDKQLEPAAEWIRKNPGKALWAGEFGTIRHCPTQYRENWMRDVIRFLVQHDIPYCVWNYLSTPYDCNRFSLVDDDKRQIVSLEMLRIIQGRV